MLEPKFQLHLWVIVWSCSYFYKLSKNQTWSRLAGPSDSTKHYLTKLIQQRLRYNDLDLHKMRKLRHRELRIGRLFSVYFPWGSTAQAFGIILDLSDPLTRGFTSQSHLAVVRLHGGQRAQGLTWLTLTGHSLSSRPSCTFHSRAAPTLDSSEMEWEMAFFLTLDPSFP